MTAPAERDLRRQLVDYGLRMSAAGHVVGPDGNLSCRFGDGLLVTPTRLRYDLATADDMVAVAASGEWSGRRHPSSELAVHQAIYRARPDVRAIIHAHPVHACVLAVRGTSLPPILDEVGPVLGGEVLVARHVLSGDPALGDAAVAALGDRHAVMLARHGTVTSGADLEEAYYRLEVLERAAHVHVLSLLAG